MKWIARALYSLLPKKFKRKFRGDSSKELIEGAERIVFNMCKSYNPNGHPIESRYAQAEYACFMYFWLHLWHEKQQPKIREYRNVLRVLQFKAEDAAPAIGSFHSMNFHKDWEPEKLFDDRVRIYSLISLNEHHESKGGPPPLFAAAHLLATRSGRNRSLELLPKVSSSGDILNLCLSSGIFGDVIEQFKFFSHATSSLKHQVPLLIEVMEELHLRRLEKPSS